ncbi:hypothetical protein TruAng_012010 [Truncatella angustata]|nr:hypothetical protein TruAng_012010 [Truncatella angustata]
MKYTRQSQIFVLFGVPMVVLGKGLQMYLTNMHGTSPANEPSFVAAKALVGLGRGFYQTAAQVSIQCLMDKEDVAVVTAVYFAAMNFGAAIGTSLLPSTLQEHLPAEAKYQAQAIYKSITVAQKYAKGIIIRAAINQSYRETQQILAIASTAVLAPMLVIMFALKNVDLNRDGKDCTVSTVAGDEPRASAAAPLSIERSTTSDGASSLAISCVALDSRFSLPMSHDADTSQAKKSSASVGNLITLKINYKSDCGMAVNFPPTLGWKDEALSDAERDKNVISVSPHNVMYSSWGTGGTIAIGTYVRFRLEVDVTWNASDSDD